MSLRQTARLLLEKSFIQRYLNTLSGSDKPSGLVDEFIADEELRRCIATIEAAFPRFEIFLQDILGEQHKIAIRGTLLGVHSGEIMGIAPTQKQVRMPFTIILRIDGGKIVEHWPSADLYGLLQQLSSNSKAEADNDYPS
jgi:predicted ester cyclase